MGLAVAFVLHAQRWVFLCDDAFISFRYARNLAEHGALVFNVGLDAHPPEYVEGYSNFLWVVVLAGVARIGIAPHVAAPSLTVVSSGLGLVAVTLLAGQLRRHFGGGRRRLEAIDLVPAAVLVASPEYIAWAHGGLETAAAAALVLAAMASWVARRWSLAAALAAAAGLCRIDALLPVALFGVAWLVVVGGPILWRDRASALRSIPWRRIAVASVWFAVPLALHMGWRQAYYGTLLPNTWAIKAHGELLRPTYGNAYVREWVDAMHLVYLAPLAVLARPRHAVVAVPIAGVVGYGWWVGGDFMAYSRFYVVATALLALLVGWLLYEAGDLAARRFKPAQPVAAVLGLGVAVLLGNEARGRNAEDRAKSSGWLDGMWEGVTAMDNFAAVGLTVGGWMRDNLPADTLISVGAAGAVPYASQLPAVDAFGLVDPMVSRLPAAGPLRGRRVRPGHQFFAPAPYMKGRDPDLLCHVGHRGPRRPSEAQAHRAFRAGYTWACIEPGGGAGFYCCRRRRDRVVGPFGEEPR